LDAQSSKENNSSYGGIRMIQPLPIGIVAKATELNIGKIILNFAGGSDEGYLEVDYEFKDLPQGVSNYQMANSLETDVQVQIDQFLQGIDEWAWDAIGYSGAGDGSEYGDDIVYDLVEKTVTHSEWYMVREDNEHAPVDLELYEEDDEFEDEFE
jgi:hypothetical protein